MPRRSNSFQRLVKHIYKQVSAQDEVSVQESVLLQEPNGASREIDILIESSVAGHKIRIAIECRQHNRKEDLIWIDQLIGKFANLRSEVQKIVAVSASGFSSSAIKKANQNGIETKTFHELEDVDWPSEFKKLGIGITRFEFEISSFQLEMSPPYPDTLFRRSQVVDADAQRVSDTQVTQGRKKAIG